MPLIPAFHSARGRRALAPAAAIAAAALLSGCGASTSSGTTATSSTTANSFNPQLVQPQTGTIKPAPTPTPHKPKGKTSSKPASTPKRTPTPAPTPVVRPTPAPSGGGGGVTVHTITVTHTVTVTHRVTVAPSVPGPAHVPSGLPALGFSRFTVPGGSIGCSLGGGTARCDVVSAVWSPPAKPRSCHTAWGQGLGVGPGGPGHFFCAGNSVLDPGGAVVAPGRDDKAGGATCQVRSIGVTCFDAAGSGFFISRTGYYVF